MKSVQFSPKETDTPKQRASFGAVLDGLEETEVIPMTDANSVADFLIRFSHEHGDPITHLKLQKLLYYAQGLHLAENCAPLFLDNIEAWTHGPVVRQVFDRFPKQSWEPITVTPDEPNLSENVEALLRDVMEIYSGYTAFDLEKKTHDESPWKDARGDLPPGARSDRSIPHESIREYFSKIADEYDSESLAESLKDGERIPIAEAIRLLS